MRYTFVSITSRRIDMQKVINGTVVELRRWVEGQVEVVAFNATGEALMIARFLNKDLAIAKTAARAAVAILEGEDCLVDLLEALWVLELAFKPYWPK